MQDHRVTVRTGDVKTVKDALSLTKASLNDFRSLTDSSLPIIAIAASVMSASFDSSMISFNAFADRESSSAKAL